MSHPLFDELPERYHDRIRVDSHDQATIDVADGAFEVPHVTDADRRVLGLPAGRHPDRVRTDDHWWFPPD